MAAPKKEDDQASVFYPIHRSDAVNSISLRAKNPKLDPKPTLQQLLAPKGNSFVNNNATTEEVVKNTKYIYQDGNNNNGKEDFNKLNRSTARPSTAEEPQQRLPLVTRTREFQNWATREHPTYTSSIPQPIGARRNSINRGAINLEYRPVKSEMPQTGPSSGKKWNYRDDDEMSEAIPKKADFYSPENYKSSERIFQNLKFSTEATNSALTTGYAELLEGRYGYG